MTEVTMIRNVLLSCLAAAIASGCGESPDAVARPAPTPTMTVTAPTAERVAPRPARPRTGITVRVVRSRFGTIVANRAGRAFYLFEKERSSKSECYGECAQAWPPVLAMGRPIAGHGVRAGLLGTTRRRDGRLQLTYRGRPMYYYVADAPGRVLCQDVVEFGGRWLVVRPDGSPVTARS